MEGPSRANSVLQIGATLIGDAFRLAPVLVIFEAGQRRGLGEATHIEGLRGFCAAPELIRAGRTP